MAGGSSSGTGLPWARVESKDQGTDPSAQGPPMQPERHTPAHALESERPQDQAWLPRGTAQDPPEPHKGRPNASKPAGEKMSPGT